MGTHPIIDRDIDFYIASLETEVRIQRRGGRDESLAIDCVRAASEVLQALRRYRLALHLAGRLDVSE
jgi:hypothetical protein